MKINDYMNGRNEGMVYALKIAKESGVDVLEKECAFRNYTSIPSQVSTKACDIAINKIKLNTIDTIQILCIATLIDEFGFGAKRIKRFMDRFNLKTECLTEDYVSWEDIIQDIKESKNIELCIRKNE